MQAKFFKVFLETTFVHVSCYPDHYEPSEYFFVLLKSVHDTFGRLWSVDVIDSIYLYKFCDIWLSDVKKNVKFVAEN